MNRIRIPLMVLFMSLPLIVGAVPSLKIVSPTTASRTNGVLNASGTATGVAPVTVYYSFNSGAWTQATGTTSWTVTGLILKPGTNSFSACAKDNTSAVSKTNTVKFVYIVNVPVTVQIVGHGTVTPDLNGKLVEVGKVYSMSAAASTGFGFFEWRLNGNHYTNAARMSFDGASNDVFAAVFKDTARPLCVIVFPAVKQSVSNSPITVTGRASDNVGVTAVNYQLNGGGWNAANLLDATNWEAANLTLNVGSNRVQALAMDAAGNVSLTNTVGFNYVSNAPVITGPAPASLAGMVAQVTIDGDSGPFQVCFGESTFAQTSTNGQERTSAGTYTYTVLSSNAAQLVFNKLIPNSQSGGGNSTILTFTNDNTGIFINGNGSNGVITLAVAAQLTPSPSLIATGQSVNTSGNTNTFVFGGGQYTNTDGMSFTNSGTYTFIPFSPLDMVLIENSTDAADAGNTSYVQLDFSGHDNGEFSFNEFSNQTNPVASDSGNFTILSSNAPPAGIALDSLAGQIWNVTQTGKAPFQFCFGTNTYSRTSSDTNKNQVGAYSFVKSGANTGQIFDLNTAPPSGENGNNIVYITYKSATSATALSTNVDNGTTNVQNATITISAAKNVVPALVAGDTFTVKFTTNTATLVLHKDGTFNNNDSNGTVNSGPYTYSVYSPIGAMVVLSFTAGSDAGNTGYLELTFTTSTTGNAFATSYDSGGNLLDAHGGTFTIP